MNDHEAIETAARIISHRGWKGTPNVDDSVQWPRVLRDIAKKRAIPMVQEATLTRVSRMKLDASEFLERQPHLAHEVIALAITKGVDAAWLLAFTAAVVRSCEEELK